MILLHIWLNSHEPVSLQTGTMQLVHCNYIHFEAHSVPMHLTMVSLNTVDVYRYLRVNHLVESHNIHRDRLLFRSYSN